MRVRPPASWSDVLLDPSMSQWLVDLLSGFRFHGKGPNHLMENARQLLVLLCSVSGDIFGDDQKGEDVRFIFN